MIEELYNILSSFAPTKRLFYSIGDKSFPETFITYQIISSRAFTHADDEADCYLTTVKVDLFAEENHTSKLKELIRQFDNTDFTVESIGAETYENAIGYWQISIIITYMSDKYDI